MQTYENLTIEVKGNNVIITIKDHTKEYGVSASGKSKTVASTRGNVQVDGANGLVLGLNAYRKA
jgi:hypothetical protein